MQVYDGKNLSVSQMIKLSALHNLCEEKKLQMSSEDMSKLFRRQLYEVYGLGEHQETPVVLQAGRQADLWRMAIAERSQKVPGVADTPSFYPTGAKLSFSSLYGQWFPRYRLIFKIAILGYETWQLAKVPEIVHNSF